ncbi:MAG: hypothetical protein AAGA56_27075 [Myxococcota bacterium]
MRMKREWVIGAAVGTLVTVGCSRPKAKAPPLPPAADAAAPAAVLTTAALDEREKTPEHATLPAHCADREAEVCTPPVSFAKRLCESRYPEVALAMFQKDTPWTRAYLQGPVEAWYAGGARTKKVQLRYAEEVLVVASRVRPPSGGGVQVSGSGSYDVIRWDGQCVSVMEGELSLRPFRESDVASIPWRRLSKRHRRTLSADEAIALRNDRRREACKANPRAKRCENAELGLSRSIARYVRKGGELPALDSIP